jgi:hypothetical protein
MQLSWVSVAPLYYWEIEKKIEIPFDFGNDISLEHLPEWIKNENILNQLHPSQKEDLLSILDKAIVVRYKAEALGEQEPNWKGKRKLSKQKYASIKIHLLSLCFWLINPTDLTYKFIICAQNDNDEWIWRQVSLFDGFRPHKKYMANKLGKDDLEKVKKLFSTLLSIEQSNTIWIAINFLSEALTKSLWEIRYLLIWIALEALFGSEDPRELSYRLSQRIAFFSKPEDKSLKEFYYSVKKLYVWRSKVVHGRIKNISSKDADTYLYDSETIVRKCLKKILEEQQLINTFISKNRESYLEDLVFGSD